MGLIYALFCDVIQPRLVITVVSGQPVGPIFKGQGVQESPRNGICILYMLKVVNNTTRYKKNVYSRY